MNASQLYPAVASALRDAATDCAANYDAARTLELFALADALDARHGGPSREDDVQTLVDTIERGIENTGSRSRDAAVEALHILAIIADRGDDVPAVRIRTFRPAT